MTSESLSCRSAAVWQALDRLDAYIGDLAAATAGMAAVVAELRRSLDPDDDDDGDEDDLFGDLRPSRDGSRAARQGTRLGDLTGTVPLWSAAGTLPRPVVKAP